MVNLYPNVSVALDVNVKLSGSFNNAKVDSKKIFRCPKLNKFFQKTHKKNHFGWVFYSFLEWVFCANPGPNYFCHPAPATAGAAPPKNKGTA